MLGDHRGRLLANVLKPTPCSGLECFPSSSERICSARSKR